MKTIEQQTSFRFKIIYYLGVNYSQYRAFQWAYFQRYCEYLSHCKNIDFDALFQNRHLKSWFETEWYGAVECEIKRKYPDLELFDEQDITFLIFLFYEANIEPFYPSVLLKEIQKETIKYNKQWHD